MASDFNMDVLKDNNWLIESKLLSSQYGFKSVSILTIISHPLFLMVFNHLSGTAVQNKTITLKLQLYVFWDFQNNGKNYESVPLGASDCVVPENIHTPTTEGIWISEGEGGLKT